VEDGWNVCIKYDTQKQLQKVGSDEKK